MAIESERVVGERLARVEEAMIGVRGVMTDQVAELKAVRELATRRPSWPVVVYITLMTSAVGILATALFSRGAG